jgi:hypothetical protein
MRTSPSRFLALAAAAVAALALAACSSSATVTTGTETLRATVTGKAAAANLNNPNQNAPLAFGTATLAGPVAGSIKPFTLTGSGCKGTVTWITSAGPLTVNHAATPCPNPNAPPPATWTLHGKTCHFTADFSTGTFSQASGLFTATTWHGNYKVTAKGYAPLTKGKTTCSFQDTGAVEASGASIVFSASGAMVKG